MSKEPNSETRAKRQLYWLPICIGAGVAIGVATGQLAAGIAAGVAAGIILANRKS